MARRSSTPRKTARASSPKGHTRLRLAVRLLGAVVLVAIVLGGWQWWQFRRWTPPRKAFAMQGVEIGAADGAIDWTAIKAIGANFAYLDASASAFARDPGFAANLDASRGVGLQTGAVHDYDPCQPADAQAANFVTIVPRDASLLPPAIALTRLADDCPEPMPEAKVVSELMTFINEIETHSGKPAILKLSPGFEARYHIARTIDRNLWLMRDGTEPDYAGRPFTLWTANSALTNAAGAAPLRWVVVQR